MLGHYRILEQIGAGGMGVVYRAHDEELERDVAVKVLPLGALADPAVRKRFRKEALALARMNHPNIETVHEFGTQDSLDFLVTEYIPGITLATRLARGPLAEEETIRLGVQLADGIEAAHKQGIIHCDLKPGNLRVMPEEHLKILDFGVARLTKPGGELAATVSITESLDVAGTLPYMAPEQLRGEKIDQRVDLWACGAVLYEMATGRRPFNQTIPTALVADIIHLAPVRPGRLQPQLSVRLEEIILKCLEKDPANRYQSAKELAVDLRRLATTSKSETVASTSPRFWRRAYMRVVFAGVLITALMAGWRINSRWRATGANTIRSLAVLPLENLSHQSAEDYFADGMTDELIATLGRVRALRVISRTSVMRYKDIHAPLPDVARALHVDAVVEGTVVRYGDHVRINAELFRAADEKQLWSESYESDLRDVLKLQRDVAHNIVQGINLHVASEDQLGENNVAAVDPRAYEAYLKGRFYLHDRTVAGFKTALVYFQQAIAKDSHYAAAYAGMADTYQLLSVDGPLSPSEAMPKAKAAALKALQLDNSLPEALTSLASITWVYDWNWPKAGELYRKAIEIGPNYAPAHHYYALYLSSAGDWRDAISEIHQAQDLDPLSPAINANVAWCQYLGHQYEEAITSALRTAKFYPTFATTYGYLGQIYAESGHSRQAVEALDKAIQLSGSDQLYEAELAYAYARSGNKSRAYALIDQILHGSKHEGATAYALAMAYSGTGDRDRAISWLEKAVAEHDGHVVNLNVHPAFGTLHSERRFLELVKQLGAPSQSSRLSSPPPSVMDLVGTAARGRPSSTQEIRPVFLTRVPTPAA